MKDLYKKYAYELLMKRLKEYNLSEHSGVTVITCTNKPHTLQNIIDNFNRQDFEKKELIIVINNDSIDLNLWKSETEKYKNIRIFKVSERISLGNCLNMAVEKDIYDIIAKFDDDDYYGPKYISDTIKSFEYTNAKVIGKGATFVYFAEKGILAIRSPGSEKKYVKFVNGSTLVFKKEIFNKVKFRDISIAEDVYFCNDCIKNNITIYSTNKYHHIYFRYPTKNYHTWKINDDLLINKYCKIIGPIKDYISYVNNDKVKSHYE